MCKIYRNIWITHNKDVPLFYSIGLINTLRGIGSLEIAYIEFIEARFAELNGCNNKVTE